jgi:hypothetical protein
MACPKIRASKKIVTVPLSRRTLGRSAVCWVQVNWFPPRTATQMWKNMQARVAGRQEPYPDPNLIEVEIPLIA